MSLYAPSHHDRPAHVRPAADDRDLARCQALTRLATQFLADHGFDPVGRELGRPRIPDVYPALRRLARGRR